MCVIHPLIYSRTVSSLTDASAKNDEVVTSLDTGNEQYEGNAVAGRRFRFRLSTILHRH